MSDERARNAQECAGVSIIITIIDLLTLFPALSLASFALGQNMN